jgi:hypothetical protein
MSHEPTASRRLLINSAPCCKQRSTIHRASECHGKMHQTMETWGLHDLVVVVVVTANSAKENWQMTLSADIDRDYS